MDELWGRRVTVGALLVRRAHGRRRAWERVERPEPVEALVTGWRTLADGTVEGGYASYFDGYEPATFHPERHFKAYVVVLDGRSGPRYALPADVCPCGLGAPRHAHFEGGYQP